MYLKNGELHRNLPTVKKDNGRRRGSVWIKQTISSLYQVTRKMWMHRNDALFNNQVAGVLYKQRKAILRAVKTQLKVGFHYVRAKNSSSICTDYGTLKKWTTPMLETWLKHVNSMRLRDHKLSLHELDQPHQTIIGEIYIERRENLKCLSTPKFTRWRLKYHEETLVQ